MNMWYRYTMGYSSAVNKNEIRHIEIKQLELEKIILSAIQIRKGYHYMLFLIEGSYLQIFRCEFIVCSNCRNQESEMRPFPRYKV